jgi:glycosyltransferase involved in cell wall biosynthesis
MGIQISVVVPSFRRPDLLGRCLGALLEQELDPSRYEVIVADDAAEPQTERLVTAWQVLAEKRGGPRIRYLAVTGPHGPAAARNRGWRAAAGEIIAFTDDDCVPQAHWLSTGVEAFAEDIAAAWGRIVMPLPSEPTDYERDAARLTTAEFVTANCFCRRAVLEALGGLDENFTAAWREDSDLFFSLLEHNAKVTHVPQAIVVHPVRPAPWGVSLRQQRKILFDALLYKKHPKLYRSKIRSSPPWHYYGICCSLLSGLVAAASGFGTVALALGSVWGVLTGRFFWSRLRHTSHRLKHIAEMALTSALIPPLAVFWRLFGVVKFRVVFL